MKIKIYMPTELAKAKRMPIGTVSRGRKKVAEGKWVPVKSSAQGKPKRRPQQGTLAVNRAQAMRAAADHVIDKFMDSSMEGEDAVIEYAERHGEDAAKKLVMGIWERGALSDTQARLALKHLERYRKVGTFDTA